MQIPLLTTRFDNFTWDENCSYREKYKMKGCLYGSATRMKCTIPLNNLVFVIEMNNSKNRVEGISLVRNFTHFDRYYKIYDSGTYNRFVYKSDYRIDRESLNFQIIEILDNILFKGKTHLKRGIGFTSIPQKLLKNEILCNNINIEKAIISDFQEKFGKETLTIEEEREVGEEELLRDKSIKKKKEKKKLIIVG
jgi:hypothetical protein